MCNHAGGTPWAPVRSALRSRGPRRAPSWPRNMESDGFQRRCVCRAFSLRVPSPTTGDLQRFVFGTHRLSSAALDSVLPGQRRGGRQVTGSQAPTGMLRP
jgi:hypothetical protein